MFDSLKLAVFFFSFSVCTVFAQVAVPSNLKLHNPGADVPQECAAFFSQTGWEGVFPNRWETVFFVEKINPDCSADVVYTWSPSNAFDRPGYIRAKTVIKGGVAEVQLGQNIVVKYSTNGGSDKLDCDYANSALPYSASTTLRKRKG